MVACLLDHSAVNYNVFIYLLVYLFYLVKFQQIVGQVRALNCICLLDVTRQLVFDTKNDRIGG